MKTSIAKQIRELKKQKNAVIMAHYYTPAEVQAVADYVGDSYYLAKAATRTDAEVVVFCGVGFMGESVKILNPEKTVLITIHATPVRTLQWQVTGQPLSAMQGIAWVSNASVTEFFWDDGTLTAGKIGQDEHLAQMKTVLPPTI